MITCVAPASRRAAARAVPQSAYAASGPARQTTFSPSYAANTDSTPSVGPADLDRDSPGGEQVGGERGAGGVGGDRAHGREEDRRGRRLVAERLEAWP